MDENTEVAEQEQLPAEQTEPAPEQDETASPEPEAQQPEEQAKTFSQEELDKIVEKRLAKERRKLERMQQAPIQADPTDDMEKIVQERVREHEARKQRDAIVEAYQEREDEARDKYEDFEAIAYNPTLPVTDVMAMAIQASEIGPELAYHLGKNPKEARRIAALHPLLQAKELGKLEVKLSAPPPPKSSSAPPPPSPVGTRGASVKRFGDDLDDAEFDRIRREYIKKRR
jgi:hypothetical protein